MDDNASNQVEKNSSQQSKNASSEQDENESTKVTGKEFNKQTEKESVEEQEPGNVDRAGMKTSSQHDPDTANAIISPPQVQPISSSVAPTPSSLATPTAPAISSLLQFITPFFTSTQKRPDEASSNLTPVVSHESDSEQTQQQQADLTPGEESQSEAEVQPGPEAQLEADAAEADAAEADSAEADTAEADSAEADTAEPEAQPVPELQPEPEAQLEAETTETDSQPEPDAREEDLYTVRLDTRGKKKRSSLHYSSPIDTLIANSAFVPQWNELPAVSVFNYAGEEYASGDVVYIQVEAEQIERRDNPVAKIYEIRSLKDVSSLPFAVSVLWYYSWPNVERLNSVDPDTWPGDATHVLSSHMQILMCDTINGKVATKDQTYMLAEKTVLDMQIKAKTGDYVGKIHHDDEAFRKWMRHKQVSTTGVVGKKRSSLNYDNDDHDENDHYGVSSVVAQSIPSPQDSSVARKRRKRSSAKY